MEKDRSQNQRNLRRLLMSVQASYGRLNLLIAICDNWKYRDELINSYEQELAAKGTSCHRVRIDRQQPSLKQSLQDLVSEEPVLMLVAQPAIVTVLGADELLGIRLNELKSAQEQFFFSAQWTREGLREFKFPIVIWLTTEVATSLAQQSPDFWSWRGGVFEFPQLDNIQIRGNYIEYTIGNYINNNESKIEKHIDFERRYRQKKIDPIALEKQINLLQSQIPESPLLARLYNILGNVYEEGSLYAEAENAYSQSLKLCELDQEYEYIDITATSLNNLGELYKMQEKYAEAEPLLLRSLSIREQELGTEHFSITDSLNNLADLYQIQGKYSKVEPLYLRSLKIREKELGLDHPSIVTSLNKLAELYQIQRRYDDEESLYKRIIGILDSNNEINFPSMVKVLNSLAELYDKQGLYGKAEPLRLRVLEIEKQIFGKDNSKIANSLINLAELFQNQGNYNKSEYLYLEAISMYKILFGDLHPDVVKSMKKLAKLYAVQGNYSKSEPLYQNALAIEKQILIAFLMLQSQ